SIDGATMLDTAPSSIPNAPAHSAVSEANAQRSAPVLSDPPATGATIDKSVALSAHHEIGQTGPPARTPPETSDQPTAPPAVTSVPSVKAPDPTVAPKGADDGKRTEPTKSSGMLIISALILGIALLRIMWRVSAKYAAARKDQIFTDDTWF